MSDQLGLCSSPEKISFIFVGEAEDEKGSTPWYFLNFDTNTPIPIHDDALKGFIYNIVINAKEFKGKTNYKLNIYVQADHKYVIRAGAGTVFARGFVLALITLLNSHPDAAKDALTISVKQGDEGTKAVFCGLYDAEGAKVKFTWDGETQLLPLVQSLQKKLGQIVQTKEMMESSEKYYEAVEERRKTTQTTGDKNDSNSH